MVNSKVVEAVRNFMSNPLVALGFMLIVALVLLGVLAPIVAPYDPYETDPSRRLQSPSRSHLFGTNQYGMDVLSQVLYGTRITFAIGMSSVLMALVTGTIMGAISGYVGGIVDEAMMRSMDIIQAFPMFVLAMGIAVAIGAGLWTVIIAIAVVNVPYYARLMRSKMLSIKRSQYALAAICVGNSSSRILFVHLLPNCLGPVFVQGTIQFGWGVLTAAGLSFLGLGVPIPTAEWGNMIRLGMQFMVSGRWWVSFFPGLAVVVAVLGFSLLDEGLQQIV